MIKYQYPPKKSVLEKRVEKNNFQAEAKKLKKNLLINIFVSLIIVVVSFLSYMWWVVLICFIIAIYNFAVSFLSYRIYMQFSSDRIYTKIFEDRIVHCQPCLFSNQIMRFEIRFDDIEYSTQSKLGEFEIHLKADSSSDIAKYKGDVKMKMESKNNIAMLKFSSTEPKMYIINNFSAEFKYIRHINSENI